MDQVASSPSGAPVLTELTRRAMTCSGAFPIEAAHSTDTIFNTSRLHRAVIPAANCISNARLLARMYALLIGDIDEGRRTRQRVISNDVLLRATADVTPDGEPDRVLFGSTTKFSRGGFHVYGDKFKAFGPGVFGHKGEICRVG
jgi:hypothetical protein